MILTANSRQNLLAILLCITLSMPIQAAAWYNFWSTPAQPTQADYDLAAAVKERNINKVAQALEQNANPNAKIDGNHSIFMQAFESAIIKGGHSPTAALQGAHVDENTITSINSDSEFIAVKLARAGGNVDDLAPLIQKYKASRFSTPTIRRVFETFIDKL